MSLACTTCGAGSAPCGCCAGIQAAVPVSEINPPGLRALTYRAGTYATFYETMLSRLTGLVVEVPSSTASGAVMPLARLTTRDASDPAIALLDAWAVVGDVLTFYQERIANEGYLATATERRSLLELARLIGYRLRPGVSASVKLAFTVSTGFNGTLPAGTRAQSIPGTGQTAQFFETSAPLVARDVWNALAPRLTRPQVITPAAALSQAAKPLVTGADVIDTVYLDGITTSISPGDALLFVFGPDTTAAPAQQYLRLAADVDAQAAQSRTQVTLALQDLGLSVTDELQLYVDKAGYLFPGSDIAAQTVAVLTPTIANLATETAPVGVVLQAARSRIALLQGTAVTRGFTRVAAWLSSLLQAMQRASLGDVFTAAGSRTLTTIRLPDFVELPPAGPASALAGLGQITGKLAQPPSRQPASPLRLSRSIAASFAPQSDMAPRLLARLQTTPAADLYAAWSALAVPAGRVQVYAARVKAALFASNWTGPSTVTSSETAAAPGVAATNRTSTITTAFTDPAIATTWASVVPGIAGGVTELPLDATYAKIKPGSWVAIDRPLVDGNKTPTGGRLTTFHIVASQRAASVATGAATGFAAKVTLLTLQPNFLWDSQQYSVDIGAPAVLRDTVIYAQTEPLTLTGEPLDTDVEGGSIDLANVYDGIEAGRWVIVSGTRTDIPGVSGIAASELAMIGGVQQGTQQPGCSATPPFSSPPFKQIYYTTDADAYGDRLVVGQLDGTPRRFELELASLAAPAYLNQQYCAEIELAKGFYANVYVPVQQEKSGSFPTFAGLLVDPATNRPFPNGNLEDVLESGIFAFRVASPALFTTLGLATPLAYKYDRSSITIYGNVAGATHGQSTGEVLGNGDARKSWLQFALSQSPLTYTAAPTAAGATSSLAVRVNELLWNESPDFAEAGANQRSYVTHEDEAQKTSVVFGSGVRGARVPSGTANVKAAYRYGLGTAGNVDALQISQLATHPLGAQGVINPLPASGGVNPDRLDQARANAPVSTIALDRLVSVSDYADFCRTYAGIGKASSVRLSDGRTLTVHVTVAGAGDAPIDPGSDLSANLLTSLQTYGDPHQPVQVAIRRVRLIVMSATVAIAPDRAWEDVAPKLRAAILALFAFDARDLGQPAVQSEAVAALQNVPGVTWVNITTFDSVAESVTAPELASLGSTLKLQPFIASELAYVDFTAAPGSANRIVPAELVFVTPDIPDTLILSQSST
jgi:hypothetical protein